MKDPVTIEIESQTKTVDTIQQFYYRVNHNEKNQQLNRLLLFEQPESCVIFCNTRLAVDRVQSFLTRKGYASQGLHGDIPQVKRLKTLQQFKQGDFHLLVATDVAARGIHIDDLSLVINYDVPNEKDSYVHRIGRTGRAGNGGRAISLVTGDDIMSLYEIEEHIGALIDEAELPSEAFFNENRASVDKWVKANSQMIKSPQAATASHTAQNQKRNAPNKPAQPQNKKRNRPIEVSTNHKTAQRVNAVHPAEQVKSVQVSNKPEPIQSPKVDLADPKPGPEIAQNTDTKTKQPFFQRLLQRILGR